MNRRQLLTTAAGAAAGVAFIPAAGRLFGQKARDAVLEEILSQHFGTIGDLQKNNGRLTKDLAKRFAGTTRLLAAHGRGHGLDSTIQQEFRQAVAAKGRNGALLLELDSAHIAHEMQMRFGVDISETLRLAPIVDPRVKEKFLDDILAGRVSLTAAMGKTAAGFDQLQDRLANASAPRRNVAMQSCPQDFCSDYQLAVSLYLMIATIVCAFEFIECAAAIAMYLSAVAQYTLCLQSLPGCR